MRSNRRFTRLFGSERRRPVSYLRGLPNRVVLTLGGFSATWYIWAYVAKALHHGMHASVINRNLQGHGGIFSLFQRSRCWQWLKDAEASLLDLFEEHGHKITLMGHSTGALVAICLAAKHPDKVNALVLQGTALKLKSKRNAALLWLILLTYYLLFPLFFWWRWVTVKNDHLFLAELATDEMMVQPYHTRIPVVPAATLILIQFYARWKLRKVKCPVLLMHGEQDQAIPPVSTEIAYEEIGSEVKDKIVLGQSPHAVTLGLERIRAIEYITAFMGNIWGGRVSPPMESEE